MYSILREHRTALLSAFGMTLTALMFALSPAGADNSRAESMSKPAPNLTEMKSNPGALLSVLQTARFINAVKGNVTLTKPTTPLHSFNTSAAQHEESTASAKQKKLERLLAYHKVMSGSVITGSVQHYEAVAAINHQPSSPAHGSLKAETKKAQKAKVAQAALINRENIIEKADTLL